MPSNGSEEGGPNARGRGCLSASLLLSCLLLPGCATGMPPDQRAALSQAARLYQQRQPSPAIHELNRLIRDYGNAPEAAEAHYLRGLCLTLINQMQPAAVDFRAAIQKSDGRNDNLAARARASLAMIHYRWGNWDQAATLYAQAVPRLPNQPPTDTILFYAGNALQRAGRWDHAREQYSRILWLFPSQPVARDARVKYYWRYNYFSIQVATFSDSDRAEASLRQFAARGLDAWQEYREGTRPARWAVLTGRYPTYAEALAALPYVRKFQADAHIVP